jgi:uncharacterized repeat protein (TIGR01451 family)
MKPKNSSTKRLCATALFVFAIAGIGVPFCNTATAQTSADLSIAIYNTPLDIYTNDYMPYSMFVTNWGPGTVSSVVVTNILPSGFSLIGASPTYTLTGNTLTFNLGSMANLAVQKLTVRAKPTSAGNYTFTATVSSTNNTDPNTANNSASFGVSVGNYLSGNLTVGIASAQFVDLNTGLEEQWIQLTNAGSSPMASARVVVSGLTSEQLFNAAGTNNGNPFIIYPSTLNSGQTGNMLLQFSPRSSFTFNNSQLQAFATPLASLTPPANLSGPGSPSQLVRVTSTNNMFAGSEFMYFPTVLNGTYTVLYSDNPEFANPMVALPVVITAPANQTAFFDYGPPATVSFPTNNAPRYYRMYINP